MAALTVGKAVSAFGGAGMSAAAKAAWTGRITGGIMSSGVAANSVLEAKKEGFSDTSALAVGIARGSIEYLSEKFSIERIMKEPTTVLKALKKSVVSEGSEEVVSNWANRLVDNIINMGLTKEYNELVASGMSEKEAFLTVAEKAAYEDLESFMGGAIAGGFMTAGHLGVQTAQVGGVGNMNQVLEYQSELAKLTDDERERIIKQNEDRYNKERAVEILTRDNINMGDIAGALNFLGVSDPQQAAKDIEHFKETGETSDLMKDKNVSSVVEVLATEGYFKKNTDKNTVNEQSQSFDNEVFENESGIELHKDFEDFPYNQKKVLKDYINSVNEEVVKSVNEVKQNKNIPFKRFTLGTVTDRAANKIKELTGYNVQGYTYAINSNALKHIEKRHGENGIHDKSMAKAEDVSRVGYVIDNYDNMELLTDKHGNAIYSREFRGKDGNSAPMFLYTKKINGTYYSAVATAENKYKKLWVVSAYISKNKEGITQVLHDELSSLVSTSDNGLASLSSDTSITQQTENVKSDSNVQHGF